MGVTVCYLPATDARSSGGDPNFEVPIRTVPKDKVSRWYEIDLLSMNGVPQTDVFHLETLAETLNLIDDLITEAGFDPKKIADDREILEDWLTKNWMDADAYYAKYGT